MRYLGGLAGLFALVTPVAGVVLLHLHGLHLLLDGVHGCNSDWILLSLHGMSEKKVYHEKGSFGANCQNKTLDKINPT